MESRENTSESGPTPQQIIEQMLGRSLTPEEEHMPINLHIDTYDIDPYLELAKQYPFIEIIEPRTRFLGGWEAAIKFSEGQTITFWQERWPENIHSQPPGF